MVRRPGTFFGPTLPPFWSQPPRGAAGSKTAEGPAVKCSGRPGGPSGPDRGPSIVGMSSNALNVADVLNELNRLPRILSMPTAEQLVCRLNGQGLLTIEAPRKRPGDEPEPTETQDRRLPIHVQAGHPKQPVKEEQNIIC